MNKSDSIKEIATALCKAQAAMTGAVKGAINPHFKKSYADMGSVVEAVKIPFSDNGLSYAQFPMCLDGKVGVETILMHVSGEWISGEVVFPITKQDPQAAGSAITYAKRYSLQSIAGIPSEDDDGNQASKPTRVAEPAFVVDDLAKQWIDAVKADQQALEQIKDAKFRAFIQAEAAK